MNPKVNEEMELNNEQKLHLYEQGYVILPGIIPTERTTAALRAINASLGNNGLPPEQLTKFRAQSYCPELQRDPVIVDLLRETDLWSLAESVIGHGQIRPVESAQIALRFPVMGPPSPPHPHLDGMYTPTNGVPEGTIANFTALVGVLLSDLPQPDAGNLAIWPGTHRLFEGYFQEHGPQSLLEGMPKVPMPEALQIIGKAGDVVLCHYQLAHGITVNTAPHIRYALYFRLHHIDHAAHQWDCMTDIWHEWPGMQELAHR